MHGSVLVPTAVSNWTPVQGPPVSQWTQEESNPGFSTHSDPLQPLESCRHEQLSVMQMHYATLLTWVVATSA